MECNKKCNSNSACYSECIFDVAGVFVDGKYQPEYWMKAVETFFVEFNFTDTQSETWLPVVKKAYETCELLSNNFILGHYCYSSPFFYFQVSDSKETSNCKVPARVLTIRACAYQMSFLNCPETLFKATEECEDIKKFVQTESKCGQMFEDVFIINKIFWY